MDELIYSFLAVLNYISTFRVVCAFVFFARLCLSYGGRCKLSWYFFNVLFFYCRLRVLSVCCFWTLLRYPEGPFGVNLFDPGVASREIATFAVVYWLVLFWVSFFFFKPPDGF